MNPLAFGVLAVMLALALTDDGEQVAQQSQDEYCARVDAGMHTDYEGKCHE